MINYEFLPGASMEGVLNLLESLPENEKIHSWSLQESILRLRQSIELRNKILAEQLIHQGQGGQETYRG